MAKNVSKGYLPWLAVLVLLVSFLAGGCDLLQKEDDSLKAPDVGSAKDLPNFSGNLPPSAEASKSLFQNVNNGLNNAIESNLSYVPANSYILSKSFKPKELQTYDETIPIGGGTVKVKGTFDFSHDDIPQTLTPNSNFSFKVVNKVNITAEINDVSIPLNNPIYKVKGKDIQIVTVILTTSGKTDANGQPDPSSLELSYSVTLQMGTALSVSSLQQEGYGGKFIISFPFEYSKSKIPLTLEEPHTAFYPNTSFSAMENDILTQLKNKKVFLKVYDNDNSEKFSVELTLEELNVLDVLSPF